MKKRKVQLSISIEENVAKLVESECQKNGLNRSECINDLLIRALMDNEPKEYEGIIYR